MCRKCVRPDSRPRGPSGLAIYLLAARPGRTGYTAQACTLRTGYCEDGHISCVASGQTSNHLKWSDLDLFFARPPRGGPEKFLFLYLNHMNRTEPISDGLRGPDGPEAQYILDGEFDPGSG